MKAAVIGIGSNSVRSLVAQNQDGVFERLYRGREGTRLFAGLDDRGMLKEESIRKTADAVGRMVEAIRANGVNEFSIFATSAARDAANGQDFLRAVEAAAGTVPEILTGEQEACLSFLGASRAVKDECYCGVIDIGGGSTEIVTGQGENVECAFSCQMGAVRLFREVPIRRKEDMEAVRKYAAEILEKKLAEQGEIRLPETWIGTGGTFTTMAAMVKEIPWTARTRMHGTRVTREEIRDIGEKLAGMPLEERIRLPGLQPGRADIVVHGICILLTVMERFEIGTITVSEWGNMDGYLWKQLMQGQAVRTEYQE
ncbi:MAG: Ppx/GppA family phosphatase [Clostridia bacterium]|nr:Ppx/GppA family phosphatase [Clostridia bacterium]